MGDKVWEKKLEVKKEIERLRVGREGEVEVYVGKYEVVGSMGEMRMVERMGVVEKDEVREVVGEVKKM